jgi:sulfite reductase (ferredoxin)
MPYTIPDSLHAEIDDLEAAIRQFQAGQLDPAILKTRRVPFGIYEQRTPGNYMCRIRCTGGAVSPSQLSSLSDFADSYGSPFLHLTTREDVQIHDVEIGRIPSLLRDLAAIGLSSRGGGGNTVRNILVSPEAGHDPDELFDPGPWADALVERIIREKDSWNLPRKFKIAFSSSDRDTAMAGFNDLGFFPVLSPAGEQGFEVWVAGGLGGKPRPAILLRPWLPASEVHMATTAIKKFFDANGNRRNKRAARLRFLRDRFGDDGLVEKLNRAVESERAAGFEPLKPLFPGSMPNSDTTTRTPEPGFQAWSGSNVRIHPRTGTALVKVPVLLGDLATDIARKLGRDLASFGDPVLRVGMRQDLVIVGIAAERLPELHALLARLDLAKLSGGVEDVVACTGADTCKLGLCFPKGAVRALREALSRSGLARGAFEGLRVHVSGCPNSCAQHMVADLGFFGAARRQGERLYPAYRVVVGGTLGRGKARLARDIGHIPAKRLPGFVTQVLAAWRSSGETEFGAWVDSVGEAQVKEILESFANAPDWNVDSSFYFDWGAAEPFSPTRGGAECSAGLFDLIDLDKESIQRERAKIAAEGATDSIAQTITFHACRMLLVAREIEPTTPSGVYDGFLLGFVSEGLVPERFRDLVEAARDGRPLAGRLDEVLELAATVDALYVSMDDSLRFAVSIDQKNAR